MSRVRTWLVLDGPPGPTVLSLVEASGRLARADLGPWPRARLGLGDGGPQFWSSAPGELLQRARARGVTGLSVLSTAPRAVCEALDGLRVLHLGRRYRFDWLGSRESHADEPFARRMLRIVHEEDRNAEGLTHLQAILPAAEEPALPHLFVEPVALELEERVLADVLDPRTPAPSEPLLFLPPSQLEREGSYFEPAALRLRAALRRAAAVADPCACDELWSLLDEPLLRDALLEGGTLRPCARDGEALRFELVLAGAGATPASDYRARFLCDPPERLGLHGPMQELVQRVRDDLVECLGERGTVKRSDARTSWSTEVPHRTGATGAPLGTWHSLERLARLLPPAEGDAFASKVTRPTRALGGRHPDHDGAERLFLAHLFRCPWDPRETERGPDTLWRSVGLTRLAEWLDGGPAPVERVARWREATDWLRLEGTVVEHPWPDGDPELLRLRLLMPRTFPFRRRGLLRLDDEAAQLDLAVLA